MEAAAEDGDFVYFKCSEAVITCRICLEAFESPRLLPCQHSFCKKCIVTLLNEHCLDEDGNTENPSFPCPICRRECKLRQHGKHSIKQHLKCFPESLLLKTILESIDETPACKPWSELVTDHDLPELLSDTNQEYGDKRYISRRTARVIEGRLWFYFLFIRTLFTFLFQRKGYISGSLNTVRRSELVSLIHELLKIPRIIHNPALQRYHSYECFDSPDVDTTLQKIRSLERVIYVDMDKLVHIEGWDTKCTFRDAQKQTESKLSSVFRGYRIIKYKLQSYLTFMFIKNLSFVKCLYEYLLPQPPGFKILDFRLSYTIPQRKLRYWLLVINLFDILTLIYVAGHSFCTSLSLLMVCYVFLLVFFKRIESYVSGGIFTGNILPLFPIFLITLNYFTNLKRCYVYCFATLHLDIWLLTKLSFYEVMTEVATLVSMLMLQHYG